MTVQRFSWVRGTLLAAAVVAAALVLGSGSPSAVLATGQVCQTKGYGSKPCPSPTVYPTPSVHPTAIPTPTPVVRESVVSVVPLCDASSQSVGASLNVSNPVVGRTFHVAISGNGKVLGSSTITLTNATSYLAAVPVPASLQDASTAFVVTLSSPSAGVLLSQTGVVVPSCFPAKATPPPATNSPPAAQPPAARPPVKPVAAPVRRPVINPIPQSVSAPATGEGGCAVRSCG